MWLLRMAVLMFGISVISATLVVGQGEGAPDDESSGQESGDLDPEVPPLVLQALVERAMSSDREEFFAELRSDLGEDSPVVLEVMSQVALRLYEEGHYKGSQNLFEQVIESAKRVLSGGEPAAFWCGASRYPQIDEQPGAEPESSGRSRRRLGA